MSCSTKSSFSRCLATRFRIYLTSWPYFLVGVFQSFPRISGAARKKWQPCSTPSHVPWERGGDVGIMVWVATSRLSPFETCHSTCLVAWHMGMHYVDLWTVKCLEFMVLTTGPCSNAASWKEFQNGAWWSSIRGNVVLRSSPVHFEASENQRRYSQEFQAFNQ